MRHSSIGLTGGVWKRWLAFAAGIIFFGVYLILGVLLVVAFSVVAFLGVAAIIYFILLSIGLPCLGVLLWRRAKNPRDCFSVIFLMLLLICLIAINVFPFLLMMIIPAIPCVLIAKKYFSSPAYSVGIFFVPLLIIVYILSEEILLYGSDRMTFEMNTDGEAIIEKMRSDQKGDFLDYSYSVPGYPYKFVSRGRAIEVGFRTNFLGPCPECKTGNKIDFRYNPRDPAWSLLTAFSCCAFQ